MPRVRRSAKCPSRVLGGFVGCGTGHQRCECFRPGVIPQPSTRITARNRNNRPEPRKDVKFRPVFLQNNPEPGGSTPGRESLQSEPTQDGANRGTTAGKQLRTGRASNSGPFSCETAQNRGVEPGRESPQPAPTQDGANRGTTAGKQLRTGRRSPGMKVVAPRARVAPIAV